MHHPYQERYRRVWESTLANGKLSVEQVEKSRYYFEDDLTTPTPKEFDTFGVVALLPMPEGAQATFTRLWDDISESLGNPLAYAVEPQNRHVELILFSRPEEIFQDDVIRQNTKASFEAIEANPPASFSVSFGYPFITPDGTVVAPGFPHPETAIDDFRATVHEATGGTIPKKQSQWFHTSLGRILDPVDGERFQAALQKLEEHWGEEIVTLEIKELYWTHEKQWYMLQKDVLHKLILES